MKWRQELGYLARLKVTRCYKPHEFGEVKTIELQKLGFNSHEKIHCRLVMARPRVTPSKSITVPRLELITALLSLRVNTFLQNQLQYGVIAVPN